MKKIGYMLAGAELGIVFSDFSIRHGGPLYGPRGEAALLLLSLLIWICAEL